jgi:hypothetical protein
VADRLTPFVKTSENSEEPFGRDRRASEIEYLFLLSFLRQRRIGNPSDCSGSQERFWIHPPEADKSQNDRNKELRQRPQGVKFINAN